MRTNNPISGAMRGILSTEVLDDAELVKRAQHAATMAGADWVKAVMPKETSTWDKDQGEWSFGSVNRGDGLHVVARAEDGTPEAIELDGHDAWFLGVQWHPEDTAGTDPTQVAVFRGLVDAARG